VGGGESAGERLMLSTKMLRELWSGVKLFAADRRKVAAEIRRAAWEASGKDVRDCWFIRLRNLSDENLLVTRVWFESSPRAEVDRRQRRLPKALAPGEAWETWLEVDKLPEDVRDRAHELARICLASGTVIRPQRLG
jgi:hypothetical protein